MPGNTVEMTIIAPVTDQGAADELRDFFEKTIVPTVQARVPAGSRTPLAARFRQEVQI